MHSQSSSQVDPKQWTLGTSTALFSVVDRESLDRACQVGLTALEIVVRTADYEMDLNSLTDVVQMARELGMTIHSVHLPYGAAWDVSALDPAARSMAMQRHVRMLQLAATWRPKVAVLHPSYEPIRSTERRERLMRAKDAISELNRAAREQGIHLCIECLPRTCLGNTSAEILEIVQDFDGLGVCCDVNHLLFESPEDFIHDVGEFIETVHISDYDGFDEKHWLPGTGIIDWHGVISALAYVGYRGPFLFEAIRNPDGSRLEPSDLREWWSRIGLGAA